MNLWAAFAPPRAPEPIPEEWLSTGQLAQLLKVDQSYCRKLIRRGLRQRLPGFSKPKGRLFATVDAVKGIKPGTF